MLSISVLSVKILILDVSCESFPKCTGPSFCHFVPEQDCSWVYFGPCQRERRRMMKGERESVRGWRRMMKGEHESVGMETLWLVWLPPRGPLSSHLISVGYRSCKKVLGSPMVRIPSFHWRTHVQSLLWDLRSHKLHGTAEKKFLQCSGSGPQWGNCVKNHLISWFQLSRGWDFVIYWDAALSDFSCRISNS